MTLDEIERVHFQRVTFTTTTADMIIIFKDYKKPVVEIDAIKVTDMDKIKEWLDSIDLVGFFSFLNHSFIQSFYLNSTNTLDFLGKFCLFRLEGIIGK